MLRRGTWPHSISTGDDAAAGARVPVGHVGGGLLVARRDESHALVAQSRECAVELDAGKTEHELDAFANELSGERFAAGHAWHGLVAPFDSHYLVTCCRAIAGRGNASRTCCADSARARARRNSARCRAGPAPRRPWPDRT